MYFTINYILGLAAVLSTASARHVLHERRDMHLDAWSREGTVHPERTMPVRIGMTQSNLDRGHQMLMEVSDPSSSRYSQYYTAGELHDLFAPSATAQKAVRRWLEDSGFQPERIGLSTNKQWMQLDATVSELEALLKTRYHLWRHNPSGKMNIACDEYHVPEDVQEHIDYITPGIKLHVLEDSRKPSPLSKRSPSTTATDAQQSIPTFNPDYSNCEKYMFPQCYLKLYNISESKQAAPGNELGIYFSFDDPYVQNVSDAFFKKVYPRIPVGTTVKIQSVDGGYNGLNSGHTTGETFLDTQVAWPIIYPQNMTLWAVDDKYWQNAPENNTNSHGWFNTWLDALDGSYCNFTAYGETGDSPTLDPIYPDHHPGGYTGSLQCGVYKPTNVISVSYGGAEAYLPANYEKRQCAEYMKLGLQGHSIFFCTQDEGVGGGIGAGKDDCYPGSDGKVFAPVFPATCPYVTAVGATTFPFKAKPQPEFIASNQETPAYSGGGFSNVWAAPSYQQKAIDAYFSKYTPPFKSYNTTNNKDVGKNGGVYNRIGRGIPDVVAVGYSFGTFLSDKDTIGYGDGSGTSYATPLWAAIVNRINDERLNAGKKPVGFVNPVLYANPQALTDITKGANLGCPFEHKAFEAVPGWDPASGLGSPKYQDLLEVFMKLP